MEDEIKTETVWPNQSAKGTGDPGSEGARAGQKLMEKCGVAGMPGSR